MVAFNEPKTASEIFVAIGREMFPDLPVPFFINDANRHYYKTAYYLLSGIDHCNKGMLISGSKGVGKTMMLQVMQRAFLDTPRQFKMVTALELKDKVLDGESMEDIKRQYGKSLKCDLFIDDIGLGQVEVNSYGNIKNIVGELIFERTECYLSHGFRTHFTSNLKGRVENSDELTLDKLYGDRAFDRIKQLTKLIVWEGGSLR